MDRVWPVWTWGLCSNDDVIKWKYFRRYWSFVLGIHRSPGAWKYTWLPPCILLHGLHTAEHIGIIMTSKWGRWRLKSPASRLFTQAFIQAQTKENIKAPRHWPLWSEFPAQRASNAENVSIWWRHHEERIWFIGIVLYCGVWQLMALSWKTQDSIADQRKHQSSASLTFVRGIHRWPVNSTRKGPVII